MATRFWVGGTGTWSASNTANWAATTGGAGGASVPGAADTVTFDANSGTSFTVTVDTGYDPTVTSVAGGFATVTLNLNDQTLTAQTFNFSGAATGAVRTLAFGTSGQIIITGNGATVFTTQIDNNLTCSGSRNVIFTYAGSVGTRTIGTPPITNIATNSLNYYIQSGSDIVTMTGASGIVARNLDLTGFNGTFNTNQLFAYGSVTLSATMTLTVAAVNWNFRGPAGGTQTLTTAGKTLPVNIAIATVSNTGTVILADDLTIDNTRTVNLTGGILNLNNRTVNIGYFASSVSTARTLAFGTSSVLNVTGNTGTIWSCATTTNLSYTGNSVVNLTGGAAGTRTVTAGTLTEANSVSFNITSGTDTVGLDGSYRNVNFTGFSGTLTNSARTIYGNLTLSPTMTVTSGTLVTTFGGTSGTKTITSNGLAFPCSVTFNGVGSTWQLQDNLDCSTGVTATTTTTLTGGTLDLNNNTLTTVLFGGSSSSVRTLAFGTSGLVDVTAGGFSVWNIGNSTNFSYTGNARINFTYNGSTGTRTISHGQTGGGSQATKAPPMYIVAGSDTIATTAGGHFTSLDFTGFTGTLTNTIRNLYGNLTLGAGMTATEGANATTFASTTDIMTMTSNGVTTDFAITINATGGTFQLTEPLLISARTLTLTAGTIGCNDFDATVGIFSSTGSVAKTLDISNTTFTLAGTGTVWSTPTATNLTINSANSSTVISDNSDGAKILSIGNGMILGNIVIGGSTSIGTTSIFSPANGTCTINSLTSTRTVDQQIFFNSGSTTIINNWGIVGTSTANVSISSDSSTQFNLIYAGAGTVNVDYYTISYSAATPADTWYALTSNNNTDAGNNSGWIFGGAVSPSTFFLVF